MQNDVFMQQEIIQFHFLQHDNQDESSLATLSFSTYFGPPVTTVILKSIYIWSKRIQCHYKGLEFLEKKPAMPFSKISVIPAALHPDYITNLPSHNDNLLFASISHPAAKRKRLKNVTKTIEKNYQ